MRYFNGFLAGLTATIVLTVLMLGKSVLGIMPELNVIRMLYETGSELVGLPPEPASGWIAHFVIGAVLWGLLFAGTYRFWPGAATLKGVTFGLAAWLLMMLAVMPLAGAGLFGMGIGIQAPILTLVLHGVFGTVLGWTFVRLQDSPARLGGPARVPRQRPAARIRRRQPLDVPRAGVSAKRR